MLPSGSLNQATRTPLGDFQMPRPSCSIPSKRSNFTPSLDQLIHRGLDVSNVEAEDGELLGSQRADLLNAQRRAIHVEDHGKRVVAQDLEPQHFAVKLLGAVSVGRGDERNDLTVGEHGRIVRRSMSDDRALHRRSCLPAPPERECRDGGGRRQGARPAVAPDGAAAGRGARSR